MKKILPPMWFFISIVGAVVMHFVLPIRRLITPPCTYYGVIAIVAGAVLNIWADVLFKRRRTTVRPGEQPSTLETSGPFSVSRHPMYLGMVLILFGVAVVLGSLVTFIFPVAFAILMDRLFIPAEEAAMEVVGFEPSRRGVSTV